MTDPEHDPAAPARSGERASLEVHTVDDACASAHCAGVRCRRPRGHGGVHEFERPDGEVFYWT